MPEFIDPKNIKLHDDLTPERDEVCANLMFSAIKGHVPAYLATLPLGLIEPYSWADIRRIMRHPIGSIAVNNIRAELRNGKHSRMFVYQRGDKFIASDDPVIFAACYLDEPSYVLCVVLGDYKNIEGISNVQKITPPELEAFMGIMR